MRNRSSRRCWSGQIVSDVTAGRVLKLQPDERLVEIDRQVDLPKDILEPRLEIPHRLLRHLLLPELKSERFDFDGDRLGKARLFSIGDRHEVDMLFGELAFLRRGRLGSQGLQCIPDRQKLVDCDRALRVIHGKFWHERSFPVVVGQK